MAIPASPNSVSFSQIQTEMGGSNPISLSEYYSGGSLVKANLGIFAPNGIPTQNQISVNDFRGAENTSEFWTVAVNFTQTTPALVVVLFKVKVFFLVLLCPTIHLITVEL